MESGKYTGQPVWMLDSLEAEKSHHESNFRTGPLSNRALPGGNLSPMNLWPVQSIHACHRVSALDRRQRADSPGEALRGMNLRKVKGTWVPCERDSAN
jgi:hypothetical protein